MDAVGPPQHTYWRRWFDSYWQLWVGLVTLSWTCDPDVGSCTPVRKRGGPDTTKPPKHSRVAATDTSPARKGWVRRPTTSSPLQGRQQHRGTPTQFTGQQPVPRHRPAHGKTRYQPRHNPERQRA